MLLISIIFNIHLTISEYQTITLQIYGGQNQSIINEKYKNFLKEIYINGLNQTNIESRYDLI